MKSVKNMRELALVKKNLRFQEMLYERELSTSSTKIINNLGDSLKDFAFEWGTKMILLLFKNRKEKNNKDS